MLGTRICLAATGLLLAAVAHAQAPAADPAAIVRVAESIPPTTLDPQQSTLGADWQAWQLAYECLLTTDAAGSIQPRLAARYSESADHLSYDFALQPNAMFHNGQQVTAEDVLYSFERLRDRGVPLLRGRFYPSLQKVEAIDPATVRFTLAGPDPSFLRNMASPGVAGCAIISRSVPEESLAQAMVGTGPYRQTGYTANQQLELAAFDRYYGTRAANGGLRVHYIPDGLTQLAGARAGQIDLFFPAPALLRTLSQERGLKLESAVLDYIDAIAINSAKPPFDNVQVRRAIALAINRAAIVNTVYSGAAVPTSYLPPRLAWAPKVEDSPYGRRDIARAKALLAEAGFPNGFSARLMHLTDRVEDAAQAAVIQSQLAAIGITVTIDALQPAVWTEKFNAPDYDMSYNGYYGFSNPYEFLRIRTNRTGPIPPSLKALMDQLPQATTEAAFQALVAKISTEEAEQAYPGIPTVARKGFVAFVPALGNVVPPPDSTRQFLAAVTVARR